MVEQYTDRKKICDVVQMYGVKFGWNLQQPCNLLNFRYYSNLSLRSCSMLKNSKAVLLLIQVSEKNLKSWEVFSVSPNLCIWGQKANMK